MDTLFLIILHKEVLKYCAFRDEKKVLKRVSLASCSLDEVKARVAELGVYITREETRQLWEVKQAGGLRVAFEYEEFPWFSPAIRPCCVAALGEEAEYGVCYCWLLDN